MYAAYSIINAKVKQIIFECSFPSEGTAFFVAYKDFLSCNYVVSDEAEEACLDS